MAEETFEIRNLRFTITLGEQGGIDCTIHSGSIVRYSGPDKVEAFLASKVCEEQFHESNRHSGEVLATLKKSSFHSCFSGLEKPKRMETWRLRDDDPVYIKQKKLETDWYKAQGTFQREIWPTLTVKDLLTYELDALVSRKSKYVRPWLIAWLARRNKELGTNFEFGQEF